MKFDLKNDWPVFIALIGVAVGICGFLGSFSLPLSKVFPLAMLIVNIGFLFYKGSHPLFRKFMFLICNAGWFYLSFKI